uniref:Uncharacterized protein n=1 Tax=Anopheles darlingi TaxID=43151 RepID=A0A2M4D993_ANODA
MKSDKIKHKSCIIIIIIMRCALVRSKCGWKMSIFLPSIYLSLARSFHIPPAGLNVVCVQSPRALFPSTLDLCC